MTRKIIQIDQETCNGCGLCVQACHEGAIAMVEGKARLIREDYCDGLGDWPARLPCRRHRLCRAGGGALRPGSRGKKQGAGRLPFPAAARAPILRRFSGRQFPDPAALPFPS